MGLVVKPYWVDRGTQTSSCVRRSILGSFIILLEFLTLISPIHAENLTLFSVGSGQVGGGYFAAAKALCETVNRSRAGDLRCSPEATAGSLYNLDALREDQLDFALVQSDWQKAAYEGAGRFEASGPMSELRGVMSLYPETITLLARPNAGIEKLSDVLGKRIDVGHPASGRRATVDRLLTAMGLSARDFAQQFELPVSSAIDALCDDRLDVTVLVSGHPSELIARALRDCAVLVPFRGPKVDAVLQTSRDFVSARIPAAAYPELDVDVPSYAVMATLVTRSDMPAEIVEALVTDNLEDLAALTRKTPILADLNLRDLPTKGMTVPLHPGAEVAYEKFGISP